MHGLELDTGRVLQQKIKNLELIEFLYCQMRYKFKFETDFLAKNGKREPDQ